MRILIVLAVLGVVAGCSSGPTPEEQKKMRRDDIQEAEKYADQQVAGVNKKVVDLTAIAQQISDQIGDLQKKQDALKIEMSQKFADLEQRYAAVMQMEQNAKKALEEAQKMTKVNDVVLRLLEAESNALKDQMRTIQDLRAEFEKK